MKYAIIVLALVSTTAFAGKDSLKVKNLKSSICAAQAEAAVIAADFARMGAPFSEITNSLSDKVSEGLLKAVRTSYYSYSKLDDATIKMLTYQTCTIDMLDY